MPKVISFLDLNNVYHANTRNYAFMEMMAA